MEDNAKYVPSGQNTERLYTRLFMVRDCTERQLTDLALHMECAAIDYDKVETEEVPMCKTIVRETAAALEYIISELEKADPGDNVAQNRKRLYKILLAKWNKKLEELE